MSEFEHHGSQISWVEEDGSDQAATLGDGCDAAVSSRLAYPEVRAALAVAGRARRLDPADQGAQ